MDLTNVISFILIAAGLYLVAELFFCAALNVSNLSYIKPVTDIFDTNLSGVLTLCK